MTEYTMKKKLAALAVGAPLVSVGFVGFSSAPAFAQGDTGSYGQPPASAELHALAAGEWNAYSDTDRSEVLFTIEAGADNPPQEYVMDENAGNGLVEIWRYSYDENDEEIYDPFYIEAEALGFSTEEGNGDDEDSFGDENGDDVGGENGDDVGGSDWDSPEEEDVIDEAFIDFSDSTVAPGDSVQLTGAGFEADEPVTIDLGEDLPGLVEITATETGEIDYSLHIPEDTEEGDYEVVATGANSEVSVSATLTIASEAPVEEEEEAPVEEEAEEREGFTEEDEDTGEPTEIEAGFVGGDNNNAAGIAGLLAGSVLLAGGAAYAFRRKEAAVSENN